MHYEDLIQRLRTGTGLPVLQALMNEAAEVIENSMRPNWKCLSNGFYDWIECPKCGYEEEDLNFGRNPKPYPAVCPQCGTKMRTLQREADDD